MHIPTFLEKIETFYECIQKGISYPLAEKITTIATPYFKIGTNFYLCAIGSLEILQSTQKNTTKIDKEQNKLIQSKAYLILHGGLLVGCSLFSLIDNIYAFGIITRLGDLAHASYIAGNILFLCANIISLEENVRLFNNFESPTDSDKDQKEGARVRKSAFWGILNNIGYIITTALLLFGQSTGMILGIAVLSCFAGGIKIIYDLLGYMGSQER